MLYFLMKRPDWIWDVKEKTMTEDGYEYEYYIDSYDGTDDDILGYTTDISIAEQYMLKYLNDKFIYVVDEEKCWFTLSDSELDELETLADLGFKVVYAYGFRIKSYNIADSRIETSIDLNNYNFRPGVIVGDIHSADDYKDSFVVKSSYVSHNPPSDERYSFESDVYFISPNRYDSITIWEAEDIVPFLNRCQGFIEKNRGLYENLV